MLPLKDDNPTRTVPFVTSLLHIGGNMLFLWIFGDNVEDALGHVRYLLFYIACGLAAAMSHMLTGPDSTMPMVGASGAVSGVLGAYMLLYPRARVLTLVFVFLLWVPASRVSHGPLT